MPEKKGDSPEFDHALPFKVRQFSFGNCQETVSPSRPPEAGCGCHAIQPESTAAAGFKTVSRHTRIETVTSQLHQ